MITKILNFTIEEDRSCFILREYWKNDKWIEIIKDEIYPRDILRCLEIIEHRVRKNKNDVIKINEYSKIIKDTQAKLMIELKREAEILEEKIKEFNKLKEELWKNIQ